MDFLDSFEQDLQDALNHLYDPSVWQPFQKIAAAIGINPQSDISEIQAAIIQAIRDLKPGDPTPPSARSWRVYNLLDSRYIEKMTQDEAAEHLGISPRHLRREQSLAIHILALRLLKKEGEILSAGASIGEEFPQSLAGGSEAWLSQVKEEVTALQRASGSSFTNVSTTVNSVVELLSPLADRYGVTLVSGKIQPDLVVRMQPAGLRQILVQTISDLLHHMEPGSITISAVQEGPRFIMRVTGTPVTLEESYSDQLIRELLALQGSTLDFQTEGQQAAFTITFPLDKYSVLVVDDNEDLVHFYKRYVQGTQYQIISLRDGTHLFETILQERPDMILLDVMLPHVDGWELLSNLRVHPEAKTIPVIVCSVVHEEELALLLGAVKYLSKPVRRQQLIQALDDVSLSLRQDR